MAVKTKKTFPNAVGANGQSSTVFTPVEVQLNNQDDLDVYVTLSGGTRVLQLRQSAGSTAQSSHPQVNDTTGLYFPAVTAGTTLYNYTLSTDNNTITFSTALPSGAVVSIERRTRDADSSYTNFASGSTIRATDLNNSSTESNFTAQEARNKAFELEGKIFGGEATSTSFISSDEIVDGTIVNADINNNAEIAVSKLANGSARQILQTAANGTDVEFTSNVDIPGTLDVTGNADIDSNLNVDGTFTVAGAADLNGNLDVDGNTNLDNTTIDGYINVTGVGTVDNVQIDGNEVRATSGNLELDSQGGTVTVDDNLTVTGNLTYNGTFNNLTTTEIAILDGATLSTAELNTLDGITSTTAELNILDGVTATASEINILDGVTATASELNIMDGVTATTSELNIMDGVTATTAELNIMDGVTSTTAELNILDGVTATAAEINTLDGVTATTAELNLNDGQTATAADVNILDGVTATTAEINKLDGYTGTAADLNEVVAGKNVVETISSTATDAQIPTAQAVNERITTVVSDVGGFVPIANETSFPTANPDLDNAAGTIVSIKALSSSFTTGVGVTTHTFTNGAGSGNNVTITGLTQSTTYPAGRGMLLETTTTSGNGSANPPRAYAFHRLTLDETGVAAAQAAINDWDERYYGPLGSEPNTRPGGGARVQGDLYFSTVDNQMKVWNNAASQWDDVASSASSNIVTLTPAFNNSETEFTCSTVPVDAQSLLLSINGVIQKPNTGTSTPSEGYVKLANGKIKLASAPATGAPYFAVALGNTVSIGTPSPDTVGATELKDGEIANVHISSSAAIAQSKLNTFVNTNGVHRIITGSATKNTLNGNSNLTYNGVTLKNQLAAENGTIAQFELSGNTNDPALLIKADESDSKITFRAGATTNVYPKIAFDMGTVGDQLTILNDGKVGIGTTAPGFKLDVAHNSTDTFRVNNTNETGHGSHDAKIVAGGSYYQNPTIVGREIKFRTFNTSATEGERIRIDKDGKLGINVTAPSELLTVGDGDLKFYHSNAANAHRTTFIEFGNSSNRITSEMNYGADNSSNYTAGLKFTTKNFNGSSFTTVDALNIQANGRVGIGTTSPAQLFHVNGQAKVNSLGIGQDAGSSTLAITGNMAINTTGNTAYSKFNIAGSGSSTGSAFTINNYGDVEGDYYHFGVNATQNASGNNSKTNTAKRSAAVRLDGRLGSIVLQTSQTSTSTIDEHFTFDRGGDFTLTGNVKVASGKGIDFSATGHSGGMTSELLDYYEEGTWTPTYLFGGTVASTQPSGRTGHYTRIGDRVFISCHISGAAVGTFSGNLQISGLPFNNASGKYAALCGWVYAGFDDNHKIIFRTNPNADKIEVQYAGASVYTSQMNHTANYMIGGNYAV